MVGLSPAGFGVCVAGMGLGFLAGIVTTRVLVGISVVVGIVVKLGDGVSEGVDDGVGEGVDDDLGVVLDLSDGTGIRIEVGVHDANTVAAVVAGRVGFAPLPNSPKFIAPINESNSSKAIITSAIIVQLWAGETCRMATRDKGGIEITK
jgi:hypothetical protein